MFKVKLILIAFCLCAVAGSQLYIKGMNDGIASIDQQAFDSYVAFAKPMQAEVRAAKQHQQHAKAKDVFALAGF